MVSKTGNIIEMLGRQRESGKEGQRDTEREKKQRITLARDVIQIIGKQV